MKKSKVRMGRNEKDTKQIITLMTEVAEAQFTSNNEMKAKYFQQDVKYLVNYIKTLEKNLALNKEIINQLCSQNKKNNENLKMIEKLNSENISLMVKVKELTKEREELVPKLLVFEQIIEEHKRKEAEETQELSNRISEITELLNKKEFLLQTIERKYFSAESLLKKYSFKDPEIRAKLRDMNVNPNDEKKISNVVEENEELRKQIKDLQLKNELLERKIEQISTNDSLKSISAKNNNHNNNQNKTDGKAIPEIPETCNIPITNSITKNPSDKLIGIMIEGGECNCNPNENKTKEIINNNKNYKNLKTKYDEAKNLITKLITMYEDYNKESSDTDPKNQENIIENEASKQSPKSPKNTLWTNVNDIIKELKKQFSQDNNLVEPDFLDLNINSPNINKEKIENNNFGDEGDNISSIEREFDKEEKQDKDSKILDNSLKIDDKNKNEEIKIAKTS